MSQIYDKACNQVFFQDVFTDMIVEIKKYTEEHFKKNEIDFRRALLHVTQETFEKELGSPDVGGLFFFGIGLSSLGLTGIGIDSLG